MRGTVQALLRPNYGRLVSEVGGLRRDEVWGKMCDIISKQLGVDRDKLAPDTRLVDDLGAE